MSKLPNRAADVNAHLTGRQPAPDRPADTLPAPPPDRPRAKAPAPAVVATPRPPASPRATARPAWIDPYTVRTASDGLDEALDCANWVLDVLEAAFDALPPDGAADAAGFALAVWCRLPGLGTHLPHWIAVHLAVNLRHHAVARAFEAAIDHHNLHGLPLPEHLREYVALREEAVTDYTRRPQGGDAWRHAARDRALTRAAYDWRLTQPAHDWRAGHPDLAAPSACLAWTINHLTDTLDRIAKRFGKWPTDPPKEQQFFPSDELCAAHGLPVCDDQDALLHRIYPQHFRGLLIGHVAALCLDEWARRIADGPAPI
ncbi:hypothetical protein [Immundisolibacter sp.]|uniref:hypothetical protein n=1 Tax=Immundisolibacter sp. TaxID=1934948 RepID=UPI0026036DFC|nr:hypothetical protein [Immundisolibacter sp.]MDD3652041.1 hypothetical protein [Immundisolibacter sp.]